MSPLARGVPGPHVGVSAPVTRERPDRTPYRPVGPLPIPVLAQGCAHLDVALEQVTGDRAPLDLVGALEDPQQSQVPVETLDRQLARVAHPAVDLHDPV